MSISCFGCKKKDNLNELSADLTTYTINIDLDTNTKTATANQTIDYINDTNSILKTLKFHLYPQFFKDGNIDSVVPSTKLNNAYPNGLSYASFEISRVQVDEKDTPFLYEGDEQGILCINLNESLLPEERILIEISFVFTLPNCCHRFGYGENTINLANFYPILCVYENGEFNTSGYHANGDPFYSSMANYNVNLSVDKSYVVAGTGSKTESISGDKKTVSFKAIMVRDFALVLSDKFNVATAKVKNTTIEYYYFDDPNFEESLQSTVDSISTFSKLFGEYPYETFSIVKCDFIHGGMEYPNLIMISADINNIDDYMNVIVHETAHQWWYGMVGNDEFKYPWLDEALTEFSTILFYDENDGYSFTHSQMVEINRANFTLFIDVYEDVLGSIDTSMRAVNEYDTEPEYTYCTYVKGTLMWESLYQLLGKDTLIKALKTYFEDNKFKNATPETLISSLEKSSKKELSNFFDSWIKGKVIIR